MRSILALVTVVVLAGLASACNPPAIVAQQYHAAPAAVVVQPQAVVLAPVVTVQPAKIINQRGLFNRAR